MSRVAARVPLDLSVIASRFPADGLWCVGLPGQPPTTFTPACTSPCTENEFGVWCAVNTPPPFAACHLVDASAGGVPYCCPCN